MEATCSDTFLISTPNASTLPPSPWFENVARLHRFPVSYLCLALETSTPAGIRGFSMTTKSHPGRTSSYAGLYLINTGGMFGIPLHPEGEAKATRIFPLMLTLESAFLLAKQSKRAVGRCAVGCSRIEERLFHRPSLSERPDVLSWFSFLSESQTVTNGNCGETNTGIYASYLLTLKYQVPYAVGSLFSRGETYYRYNNIYAMTCVWYGVFLCCMVMANYEKKKRKRVHLVCSCFSAGRREA